MPNTKGKKKIVKSDKSSSNTASNISNMAGDTQSINDVIKLLLSLIDKVENSKTTTIEHMTNFIERVFAERQASTDLKLENVNKEIFELNVKYDKIASENDVLRKKGEERDKYIQHLEAQLETANNESDEIQINVNRP